MAIRRGVMEEAIGGHGELDVIFFVTTMMRMAWRDGAWRGGAWSDGAWRDGAWRDGAWGDGAWGDGCRVFCKNKDNGLEGWMSSLI